MRKKTLVLLLTWGVIVRKLWRNLGALRKLLDATKTTTRSGTRSMKSWSSLNERMAIVWCQPSTSKTSLLGYGFVSSGQDTPQRQCDLIERNFWTNLGSLGVYSLDRKELLDELGFARNALGFWTNLGSLGTLLEATATRTGTRNIMTIVWCHKSTRETRLLVCGLVSSGQEDTPSLSREQSLVSQ
jgi:hypothetical protein